VEKKDFDEHTGFPREDLGALHANPMLNPQCKISWTQFTGHYFSTTKELIKKDLPIKHSENNTKIVSELRCGISHVLK